jgi:hypothetical protein
MNQTNHFFDLGYGWLCKHCSAEDAERIQQDQEESARFFSESEAEEKESKSVNFALARWSDSTALTCPRDVELMS